MDEKGWSILRVAKLIEDTEAWDQVQLRPGLLVDTVTTYDGEDYSCRDTSTAELIQKIDSPQRPLKIAFRDPEFDTAEAKALVAKSKAERDKIASKTSKKPAKKTDLSEGKPCSFRQLCFVGVSTLKAATCICIVVACRSSAGECGGVQRGHITRRGR